MTDEAANPPSFKIIMLGAGKSERFKAIKVLAKIAPEENSISLIQHTQQNITTSLNALNIDEKNLYIATGRYHKEISVLLGNQFPILYCSQADLGLGHTIAQSVQSMINKDANVSHIMVTLADQVALTADDYSQLIKQSASMPERLVCAIANDEMMPPAIFPRRYFTQLMSLTGDKGAKALLFKNKDNLQCVELPNAAIDIDTKEALVQWQKGIYKQI